MHHLKKILVIAFVLGVSGCAHVGNYQKPHVQLQNQWHESLPHGGKLENLENWWTKLNDPMLLLLIQKAQEASPTVSAANLKIAESQMLLQSASATYVPTLDVGVRSTRAGGASVTNFSPTLAKSASANSSVGVNLFGVGSDYEAAKARKEGSVAAWHSARIQVAAEVANQYIALRACEGNDAQLRSLVESYERSDRAIKEKASVGFYSTSEVADSQALLLQTRVRHKSQSTECRLITKSLVALTSLDEVELVVRLQSMAGNIPKAPMLSIEALPIQVISQRPDVMMKERELAAANADIDEAKAALFPRFSLTGSIGYQSQTFGGNQIKGSNWSFGPALDIPLFDYGRRKANVNVAIARYENALIEYKNQVRVAVKDVEDALSKLNAEYHKEEDLRKAALFQKSSFLNTEKKYQTGFSSAIELESARRLAIEQEISHRNSQKELASNWINLYLAVYGDWNDE